MPKFLQKIANNKVAKLKAGSASSIIKNTEYFNSIKVNDRLLLFQTIQIIKKLALYIAFTNYKKNFDSFKCDLSSVQQKKKALAQREYSKYLVP